MDDKLLYPCLDYKSVNGSPACVPCDKKKSKECGKLIEDLYLNVYSGRDKYFILKRFFEDYKCYDFQCLNTEMYREYLLLRDIHGQNETKVSEVVAPSMYQQYPTYTRRGRFSHIDLVSNLEPIPEYETYLSDEEPMHLLSDWYDELDDDLFYTSD
jgi:hypothetical protein